MVIKCPFAAVAFRSRLWVLGYNYGRSTLDGIGAVGACIQVESYYYSWIICTEPTLNPEPPNEIYTTKRFAITVTQYPAFTQIADCDQIQIGY